DMIFVFYNIYHIRYILLIYGKYHIKYDFMHIVCLSYLLRGFRHTDPETPGPGSAFCSRGRRHLKTQYVPLRKQHYLLYVVLCTFSVTRRAGAEKTASFIS
ncbi:hypothetical protein M1731_11505, partial [Salmonella enterica subsp. enterica serovar Javiana]|uniref:hypothetical protein n=1 Tax=Salmonella enterica TaxID=28901 RepID=UPI0021B46864